MYDPAANAWNRVPSMPTERGALAGDVVGGALYLVGGTDGVVQRADNEALNIGLPHLACYAIAGAANPPHVVRLADQFGVAPSVDVGRGKYLCTPVVKTVIQGPENPATGDHLECYSIPLADRIDPPDVVRLADQFGVEPGVAVRSSKYVCVPTEKTVVGAGAGGSARR